MQSALFILSRRFTASLRIQAFWQPSLVLHWENPCIAKPWTQQYFQKKAKKTAILRHPGRNYTHPAKSSGKFSIGWVKSALIEGGSRPPKACASGWACLMMRRMDGPAEKGMARSPKSGFPRHCGDACVSELPGPMLSYGWAHSGSATAAARITSDRW